MTSRGLHPGAGRPAVHAVVRWMCLVMLAYWGVFALSAPVLGPGAQVYNMARLWYAYADGLFGNQVWNDEPQMVFPWSFDALHYPFGSWPV